MSLLVWFEFLLGKLINKPAGMASHDNMHFTFTFFLPMKMLIFFFWVRASVIYCILREQKGCPVPCSLGKLEKQPEHRRQNICDHDISTGSCVTLTMWQDRLQDILPPFCSASTPCSLPWLLVECILMEVTQSRSDNGSFGPKCMTSYTEQMRIYYIFLAGIHTLQHGSI